MTSAGTGSKQPTGFSQRRDKPLEGVLALRSEEVNVRLELQLEDVLLVDAVALLRGADRVAQQREASQREVVLKPQTCCYSRNRLPGEELKGIFMSTLKWSFMENNQHVL